MTRPPIILMVIVAIGFIWCGPALAENLQCETTVTGGTWDNVVVPPNAGCFLAGAVVRGNVFVLQDASLLALGNNIAGNITATDASSVQAEGNVVGGTMSLHVNGGAFIFSNTITGSLIIRGVDQYGVVDVCGTTLVNGNLLVTRNTFVFGLFIGSTVFDCPANIVMRGNLTVNDNRAGQITGLEILEVVGNRVDRGNMEVSRNTGFASQEVQDNTVASLLTCIGNSEPFIGAPNSARIFVGQCAAGP